MKKIIACSLTIILVCALGFHAKSQRTEILYNITNDVKIKFKHSAYSDSLFNRLLLGNIDSVILVVKNTSNQKKQIDFIISNSSVPCKTLNAKNSLDVDEKLEIKIDSALLMSCPIEEDGNLDMRLKEKIENVTLFKKQYKRDTIEIDSSGSQPILPYDNSLSIAKLLNKNDSLSRDSIFKILSYYLGSKRKLDSLKLYSYFSKNAFIKENIFNSKFYDTLIIGYLQSNSQQAQSLALNAFKSIGSTLGSLDATIYADAFAKIVIKRLKQDLNEIFFEKMKKEMSESLELRTLLPKTYSLLHTVDRDIYEFKTYVNGLRERFEEDLTNIFAHTNNLLETDKYADKFKNNPTLRGFLTTVGQFADGLVRKQHPGKVIEQLYFSPAYEQPLPNGSPNTEGVRIKGGMQAIQLFSKGLRSKDSSHYWVSGFDSLNMLFKNDALGAQIWLGLMYQLAVDEKGIPLKLSNDKTLRQAINHLYEHKDKYYGIERFVNGLYRRANQIGETWQSLQKEKGKDNTVYWRDMVQLYENTVDFIKFSPTIEEVFDPQFAMPRDWYRGIYLAEALPSIYAEMKGRQYHTAVQHFVGVAKAIDTTEIFVNDMSTPLKNIAYFYLDLACKKPLREYRDLVGLYFKKNNEPQKVEKLVNIKGDEIEFSNLEKILMYGTLAASLALAKTSDEASEILESTMTPSGSTRKKERGIMIGINSYIGYQYIRKSDKEANANALSAPIGLNVSFGLDRWVHKSPCRKLLPHNVQVLFGIVDIGALAGLRLQNDTISIPKVRLENIFSPGISLLFGRWFNLPLNVGFGIQAQPRVYAIKDDILQIRPFQVRRTFNISWDIPLWNIKHIKRD